MANTVNLTIDQGTTFSQNIAYVHANGSAVVVNGSFSAVADMRPHFGSNSTTAFTTSLANGVLTISLSANTTANTVSGRYVWDTLITQGDGTVVRLAEGLATVRPSATVNVG